MPIASAIISRIPPACRCPMMKMWAAFASLVPGLVVSASSVSDVWLVFASSAQQVGVCFIRERHVAGV